MSHLHLPVLARVFFGGRTNPPAPAFYLDADVRKGQVVRSARQEEHFPGS